MPAGTSLTFNQLISEMKSAVEMLGDPEVGSRRGRPGSEDWSGLRDQDQEAHASSFEPSGCFEPGRDGLHGVALAALHLGCQLNRRLPWPYLTSTPCLVS